MKQIPNYIVALDFIQNRVVKIKLSDEDKQFAEFEEKQLYDYIITNINLEESITSVINIINSNNELVR